MTERQTSSWALGLDTGGTFTDAVILQDGRRVVASAKALTTPADLSQGLAAAIRAVLRNARDAGGLGHIGLVSVSTTLATNAIVENRFSPICTLLIGFDDVMAKRSGLERCAGHVVRIAGGHDATGTERQALDEASVLAAVASFGNSVEAFAIAAQFSVRNPAHEVRARQLVRQHCRLPVTCAHELSSRLDAPRRALTAALNARLTPQINHLIDALREVLAAEDIMAPLMIVRGDGSLMRADVALEYPVETVLSGPAASVVGAGHLTGLKDFVVSDMGGTTTDIAVVQDGLPATRADGALIGGWRTMVAAVDVHTRGLGGDSEVRFDNHAQMLIGPRKVMPLSLLAVKFPQVLGQLQALAITDRLPDHPTRFAYRNSNRVLPVHAGSVERRVWDALQEIPQQVSVAASTRTATEALERLADLGLVTIAGFTPSDAMHVLGSQEGWSVAAAQAGAQILATLERNILAARAVVSVPEICQRIHEQVVVATSRALLAAVIARDPGIENATGRWDQLAEALLAATARGQSFSTLVAAPLQLSRPLVAIGAPVAAYYPEVARRLGTRLAIPEHAAVCNAVGAVAGVVSQSVEVLVNQPSFKVFRVHDPAGNRDFSTAEAAIECARTVSQSLALAAALRAGAQDPHVETTVLEQRGGGDDPDAYLAEARVRSIASGRPASA